MIGVSGALVVAAVVASGVAVAALSAIVMKPTRRLGPRVRPYTAISRSALGRSPDIEPLTTGGPPVSGGTLARLLAPMIDALARRLGRLIDRTTEPQLLLRLRHAGRFMHLQEDRRVHEYRVRQLGAVALGVAGGLAVGLLLNRSPLTTLALGGVGFVAALGRYRGGLDRAIEERKQRMRIEIYTINQLLAMRVRVGGGVVQAIQSIAARGNGAVVDELREALRYHRSGISASASFARAAELTPERHCARTYSVLAAAEERGADLADALLSLSEDVREARREAIKRTATKRRAAMLIPTIAILAPVMLLFVIAPLPSLIFGLR